MIMYQNVGDPGDEAMLDEIHKCQMQSMSSGLDDAAMKRGQKCIEELDKARENMMGELTAMMAFTNNGPGPIRDIKVTLGLEDEHGDAEFENTAAEIVPAQGRFSATVPIKRAPRKAALCVSYRYGPGKRMYTTMMGIPEHNTGMFDMTGGLEVYRSKDGLSIADRCPGDLREALAKVQQKYR